MDYTKIKNETEKKIGNLETEVGDIFTEMLSYWELVIDVTNDSITTIDSINWDIKLWKKDEWKYRCSYKGIDGYWIDFHSNNEEMISKFMGSYFNSLKTKRDKDLSILILEDYPKIWDIIGKHFPEQIST